MTIFEVAKDNYRVLRTLDPAKLKNGIKALSKLERDILLASLETINTQKNLFNNSSPSMLKASLEDITKTIKSAPIHSPSNFIVRIFKGFLNLIKCRTPSKTVLRMYKSVASEMLIEDFKSFKSSPCKFLSFLHNQNLSNTIKKIDFSLAFKQDNTIFDNVEFNNITFKKCDFRGIAFKKTVFVGCNFQNCQLDGVYFSDSVVVKTINSFTKT